MDEVEKAEADAVVHHVHDKEEDEGREIEPHAADPVAREAAQQQLRPFAADDRRAARLQHRRGEIAQDEDEEPPRERLLRVPGLGVRAVNALVVARRQRRLRLADVGKLTVSLARVRPFIVTEDWRPVLLTDRADLRSLVTPAARGTQLELFA